MTPTGNHEAANVELVRQFHQRVLTEKDLDAAPELLASTYVEHNPSLPGGELRGLDNLIPFWEDLFEAFPDLWIEEQDVLAQGDTVVTRHVGRGTHEGPFMDLPATGNEFEIPGIDVYEIEDGRIGEGWISLDMIGLLHQLGAMPGPEEG